MVWNVNGNHTSESPHARKRYQESFRRTGGSANMKMRSCCTEGRGAPKLQKGDGRFTTSSKVPVPSDHKSLRSENARQLPAREVASAREMLLLPWTIAEKSVDSSWPYSVWNVIMDHVAKTATQRELVLPQRSRR